eukprot:1083537-Rhodomonas_salina.1
MAPDAQSRSMVRTGARDRRGNEAGNAQQMCRTVTRQHAPLAGFRGPAAFVPMETHTTVPCQCGYARILTQTLGIPTSSTCVRLRLPEKGLTDKSLSGITPSRSLCQPAGPSGGAGKSWQESLR